MRMCMHTYILYICMLVCMLNLTCHSGPGQNTQTDIYINVCAHLELSFHSLPCKSNEEGESQKLSGTLYDI